MTLVDDFYKQMEPSIKAFLDDNITIADKEEADRVYRSVKYYKKLNRLPPPERFYRQKQVRKSDSCWLSSRTTFSLRKRGLFSTKQKDVHTERPLG